MQMCLRKSLVNYAKVESNIHAYWNSLSFFLLSRKSTKELYSLKSSALHGIEKNKTELYDFYCHQATWELTANASIKP